MREVGTGGSPWATAVLSRFRRSHRRRRLIWILVEAYFKINTSGRKIANPQTIPTFVRWGAWKRTLEFICGPETVN